MNNSLAPMQASLPGSISYADPAAVAAAEAAKARIQAAYIMAMQRPRSYDQSRIKILEACSRPAFAEKVEYRKPVGRGDAIVGPSIRFAELALREWGNISYENQVVYDDDLTRRINVVITDLETNTTFSASIQLAKTVERKNAVGREVVSERINSYGDKVYIVKATDDEIANKQAALVSKALRNEGLRLIPQDIIEEAIERARETVAAKDKRDPDAARKKLADAFAAIGVMPADIEAFLGHSLARCAQSEIQELRAMFSAIRDGEAKWSDYMTTGKGEDFDALAAKEKLQDLKARMKEKTPESTPPGKKSDKTMDKDTDKTMEPEPVREPGAEG
jgi:hypothetical protein